MRLRSKRKLQATKQKRITTAGAMREEQHGKRSIKLNLRNKLVLMQKKRRSGKRKPGNDGKLNESGKKNRGSGTKRGARNSVLSTSKGKRKDKSDMNAEDERTLATDIEAIIFLEAMTVMKALVCQHHDIEIMIDELDLELERPRLSLLHRRRLQLMIRLWRKRLYNYS